MPKFITSLLIILFCAQLNAQDLKLEVANHIKYTVCESTGARFIASVRNIPTGITVVKVVLKESSSVLVDSNGWSGTSPWKATVFLKKGLYDPILEVTFSNNTTKKVTTSTSIKVVSTKPIDLGLTINRNSGNCIDDTIGFSVAKRDGIRAQLWSFGSQGPSSFSQNSSPKYVYQTPGSYSVSYSVMDGACGVIAIDTSVAFVNVAGPKALIHHPAIETGHAITKPTAIPLDVFKRAKATGKPKTIEYDELKKVSPYAIETYDVYHGASYKQVLDSINIENSYLTRSTSRYDKVLIDKPTSSQKANVMAEYELVKRASWKPTDPLPTVTVYQPGFLNKQFDLQEYAMPDTMIYGNGQPNFEVQFTNFSTLFRPSASRTSTYQYGNSTEELKWRLDSVKFPSFPYAGDTLQYFWDFNDPSAKACTSTVSKPDASCAFSTEKLPKHIYAKPGCFSPSLTATDPKTGCTNTASIQISNQSPDAGWNETAYGKSMSLLKQTDLKNKGFLDGLGLQLTGSPCAANAFDRYFQTLDISGTLPSCGREDYWIVFDAAKDCDTIRYKTQVNGSTVDTFTLACEWLNSEIIENILAGRWSYPSPGWKSVGLVIKNGDAYDTTFYSNYKYIVDANADFDLVEKSPLDSLNQTATFYSTAKYPNRPLDSMLTFAYVLTHEGTPLGNEPFVKIDSVLWNNGGAPLKSLNDTFFTKPLIPGKYRITSSASGKQLSSQCHGAASKQFWIGHFADLRVKNKCFGDTAFFYDSIFYWRDQYMCDLGGDVFNFTCTDREKFFTEPVANQRRQKFLKRSGYTLPKFVEKVAYDFENDGVIDFTYQFLNGKNTGVPKYVYPKPGRYTCALWSMDSVGLWQKDTFPVVISSSSTITLKREREKDSVLYCLPNRYILKADTGSKMAPITSVSWYVNNQLHSTGQTLDSNPSFVLETSGQYLIKAVIKDEIGCTYHLNAPKTRVIAPKARYNLNLPKDNCAPLKLVAKNKSQGASQYNWLLNGTSIGVTNDVSDFNHTISQAGKYNLLLVAQATYITAGLDTVHCNANYSTSDSFVVRDEITSSFSVDKSQGLKVQFDDKSTNAKGDIDWLFYDGTSLLKQDVSTVGNPIVYTFPSSGDYRICQVIRNENCSDSTCQDIWVAPSGITESSDGELKLYPNPSKGRFTIERSSFNNNASVTLYNTTGKQVWTKEIRASEQIIEVNATLLTPGVYLLKLTDKDSTHKAQLMIE